MRLKKLLNEQEWTKKLNAELDSGKWATPEISIYRGRKTDEKPVMVKETTGGRRPKDTNPDIHRFVNTFHDVCFRNLPNRNEVRFGTTIYRFAKSFVNEMDGEGRVYQIFPAKSATVYHRDDDPLEVFEDANLSLSSFMASYRKWFRNYGQQGWMKYPDDLMYLADSVKESVQEGLVRERFIQELGCPSTLKENINEWEKQIERNEDLEVTQWFNDLAGFIGMIHEYFKKIEPGYPDRKGNIRDEVSFKGKYLQVDTSIDYFDDKKLT